MSLSIDALDELRKTSRTFFIPIIRLPGKVRDAVGSAYLCMRSIDEIEDHQDLDRPVKVQLLHEISALLYRSAENGRVEKDQFQNLFQPYENLLPRVTLGLPGFASMAPPSIAGQVWSATAGMSREMGNWVQRNFQIETENDLDLYTYDVAGRVGELLTDIWKWYDGTEAEMSLAIGFGRCLQAVNIIRNREEDLFREVDFYPKNWTTQDLHCYVRRQADLADAYMMQLPSGPVREFCRIPLVLAKATLDTVLSGQPKLSRAEVLDLVGPGEGTE